MINLFKWFWYRVFPFNRPEPQISFLVPFRANADQPHRARVWAWLLKYWLTELPDIEIVMGESEGQVFSKTEAVNNAASRARGRIFVIIDSDTYMDGAVIQYCADAIDRAMARGHQRWFIPYRSLYRLTEDKTSDILVSDPTNAMRVESPPPLNEVESTVGSMHGRRYGALIQIMPREAFELVGGMDPRFRGWGGEDISFARAVDTLYGNHKTTDNDVLHLWHPKNGDSYLTRTWNGQDSAQPNKHLATRYSVATGDRARMRALVDEGLYETED